MKKNLSLFGILVLLLGLTYFFQEKRAEKEYQSMMAEGRLFKDAIIHLKIPGANAEKKNNSWYEGDQLLSYNSFKIIEKKLSEIKQIKAIQGEWKNFFPNPFTFEVNHVPWTIGDLSLDKQAFYIGSQDKIYLAIIEGESMELTQNEDEIASIKLNELVSTLSKPKQELKENQFFRYYTDLPMEKVVVSVEGSLPFELDFEKNETSPPPIAGIKVHKDLRGKFHSLLTQALLLEVIPYDEKLKVSSLGKIEFMAQNKKVTWELWLNRKGSADAFILDSSLKKAFKMSGGTLKIFFVTVQDYWDKKIIPQEEFESFSKLNIKLVQGKRSADVVLLNKEPMSFEAKGFKVDQLKMEELIQFLFNLGPKDQADRVSQLAKTEKQMLLSGEHLRIEIMNQEIILWRKQEELIVVNLTQGFKAHFALLNESFRGTFEDMLK